MNNLNTKLMILLAGFSLVAVGCGSSGQFQSQNYTDSTVVDSGTGVTPTAPPGTGTGAGTGTTTGSNVADFTPVSFTEFSNYVGGATSTHRLNNPSDYKLVVDLKDVGGSKYAGQVKITYMDAGQQYTGTFESGSGTNQSIKGMYDNGVLESEYNYWFNSGGKTVFTGFFQDNGGGLVVVIDNVVNQGDGQGSSVVSGSVYYKNFPSSYIGVSPYRKCWFIRSGPFSCRAESVINKSSTVPDGGFIKLGTFTGLSVSASFK